MNEHVGLHEFVLSNVWFLSLVAGMINNNWSGMMEVNTKLDNLSNKESEAIGRAFSAALEDRMVSESGVDLWIQHYPALVELTKSSEFFLPMAITIGKRKLKAAPWGLALKVGVGALISLLNVGTDIYTVFNFKRRDEYANANATVGMISLSIALQWIATYASNKKRGTKVLLKEAMVLLSFFKPMVQAFRVVSGVTVDDKSIVEPMFELIAAKTIEM